VGYFILRLLYVDGIIRKKTERGIFLKKLLIVLALLGFVAGLVGCANRNDTELENLRRELDELRVQTAETQIPTQDNRIELPSQTPPPAESTETPTQEPSQPAEEREIQELIIKEFGYRIRPVGNEFQLYHSIFIYNPNEHVMVRTIRFRITAFSEDGRILGTRELVRGNLEPKGTLVVANSTFRMDELPARVEAEIIPARASDWISNFNEFIPLEVVNVSKNSRNETLGEIINHNDRDLGIIIISVVYRDADGLLIGGRGSTLSSMSAMSSAPFSISRFFAPADFDEAYSFEVFAFADQH